MIFVIGAVILFYLCYKYLQVLGINLRSDPLHRAEVGLKAIESWNDASKKVREYYMQWEDMQCENLQYSVPNSPETLDKDFDIILEDPIFQRLQQRERETYVFFLETHPYCIKKEKLITMLEDYPAHEEATQRLLKLIFK